MGCKLSAPHQVVKRKISQVITGIDLENGCNQFPKIFVANDASQMLHDAIEKRDEDLVVKILYFYKDEEYKQLLDCFLEEYCIDPVTLAFQNLSSNTSEFVRLRLTSQIKNVCHFINFHLRDKTTNFQNRVLGIILGFQDIDLKHLTREYFNNYGYLLSNHIYSGFEGEILDFLSDLLNRNTEALIFEENFNQEKNLSESFLSSPLHQIINKKRDSKTLSTSSIRSKIERKKMRQNINLHESSLKPQLIFEDNDVANLAVQDCVKMLHDSCITQNLTDGDLIIFKLLAICDRQKLKDIFELYLQQYKRDIVPDIENSAPESYLRDLLVLSVQILRCDSLYFANEIHNLLKSTDEDSAKNYYLMFYLMTRNEESITQIKKAYRNHYFESLSDDIRSLVTDPLLQTILIKALTRVSSKS